VKLLADRAGAEINIGSHSRLNGVCVHAVRSISIGARCLIAAGVQILDSHGHIASMHDPSGRINTTDDGSAVIIEDDVWIGLNAIVLPGTRIGYGSIVGAGVVVAGAIPPGSVVKSADFVVTNKSHCAY
jgi:acetyltransferase-like isoleucine patch superfamily enzyme